MSLDAFRGITIAAMILVNNPGSWEHIYKPLQHAAWNGWRPADFIFPFFLFIVGVATTFSLGAQSGARGVRQRAFARILRRTLTIFALGIFLNGFPLFDWSELRIPGVLQRIAVCYLCASVAVLTLTVRGQTITATLLLIGYWAMMTLVPVPGHAAGRLLPGANLAAYVDDALLHKHLLHQGWDPEGPLTTIPAIGTTLSGVLVGQWLVTAKSRSGVVSGLFFAGNACLVLGLVANHWFPINKSLWTSSYVLFTSGAAANVLAMCYWLIECEGYQRWAMPFIVFGTNPIVAYVLSSLMAKMMLLWMIADFGGARVSVQRYIYESWCLAVARPLNASLIYALGYVLVWLGITAVLYRQEVVIKM